MSLGAAALTVIAEVFEVQSETGMPPPRPWGSPSHLDRGLDVQVLRFIQKSDLIYQC